MSEDQSGPERGGWVGGLLDRVRPAITGALFLLAAVLVLLGIATELTIPKLGRLSAAGNMRGVALVLGSALLLVALAQAFGWIRLSAKEGPGVPDDLRNSFAWRRQRMGATQDRVLRAIESAALRGDADVPDGELRNRVPELRDRSDAEIHYRLEHLRLLGFIARAQAGGKDVSRVTPVYHEELRDGRQS